MKLFDFFKKEKKKIEEKPKIAEKKEVKEKKEVEPKVVEKEKKEEKPKKKVDLARPPRPRSDGVGQAWRVLEQPHISEKATDLTKENKYIFRVFPKSNKKEIKKAVEGIYGVDVLDVRTVSIPRKKKMRGRILGWKKGYKKAIVKIKKGQKIELLPR
ncbi:50S ribosomal protein L23 [Candidatus Parcubacteria bacterium]|nr:50S ribosomal protein L23 [Candidatus Parcubacteria bacterium]